MDVLLKKTYHTGILFSFYFKSQQYVSTVGLLPNYAAGHRNATNTARLECV
jgi:hypothetical protein